MSSFKESGGIEYGAGVLLGLQLKGAGASDFNVEDAKKKDPREIELKILKNRNGATGLKIEYLYFPKFNYMKECTKNPKKPQVTEGKQWKPVC